MRVLAIGDIVGKPGRKALKTELPRLREELGLDLVIANGENAAGGFGLTEHVSHELWEAGVDIITSGNHIWKKREIYSVLSQEKQLLRPANYPPGAPGRGWTIWQHNDLKVAVVNLAGRTFLEPLDCPFRVVDSLLPEIRQQSNIVIIDFHAEATSEKIAFGWYVDGRASLVFGTHTHVQTADSRILPHGTGYITDIGMTGPRDGVLGVDRDIIIQRFITQLPARFHLAKGDVDIMGVWADIDPVTGYTLRIERLYRTLTQK
ncbi:MAG TPA: TIGR00282 family metallophosphoesterase [Firmicutes bacterium]|nr:TIGR00282 family metallophosphoesterase [Bacillota bacterium]